MRSIMPLRTHKVMMYFSLRLTRLITPRISSSKGSNCRGVKLEAFHMVAEGVDFGLRALVFAAILCDDLAHAVILLPHGGEADAGFFRVGPGHGLFFVVIGFVVLLGILGVGVGGGGSRGFLLRVEIARNQVLQASFVPPLPRRIP